jgi:cellulose synthase/poly-beta-1,6-N-acetylglucosamine synthase-like glycosyltransferase
VDPSAGPGVPPLVSVVVPVLHDGPGIRACLEALLRQTYPPDRYEIVVADNGSMDGTRTVVERARVAAGSRLSLVVEDRVRTSYAARNRALRAARGEILAFTDADCIPAPTWLEQGVRALRAEGAACAGGRIVVTYAGRRPNAYEYWDSAIRFNQASYVTRHYAATANLFVQAHMFERHGPFRPELVSGGDREFGIRLWKAGERLVYAPDAVVAHAARATLEAVYRKSLRLALAHRPLHRLGVVPPGECTLRLIRSWRCPVPRDWTGRLPLTTSMAVRLLHHLHAWFLLTVCFGQGFRTWEPPRWLTWRDRRPAAVPPPRGSAPS